MRREASALQFHSVHTDVDEYLDAGRGLNAVCVTGWESNRHLAVTRGNDDGASGGGQGNTGAERSGGEGLVGHVRQRNDRARHGGGERQISLRLVAESGSSLGRRSSGGSSRCSGSGSRRGSVILEERLLRASLRLLFLRAVVE